MLCNVVDHLKGKRGGERWTCSAHEVLTGERYFYFVDHFFLQILWR